MIVQVKRYDFVNMTVSEHDREIPDEPPSTPFLEMLKRKTPNNFPTGKKSK